MVKRIYGHLKLLVRTDVYLSDYDLIFFFFLLGCEFSSVKFPLQNSQGIFIDKS